MTNMKVKKESIKFDQRGKAKNFEYSVQMSQWLLKALGLWPIKSDTNSSIYRTISISVCTILLIFRWVPNVFDILLIEKRLKVRLKLLGSLTFSTLNIFKYYGILSKNKEIRDCITKMALDWNEVDTIEERDIMMKNARFVRVLTTICLMITYTAGLFFNIIVPIVKGSYTVNNVTHRHLAVPAYYIFFNPRIRPNYELVYTIQCISGVVNYTIATGLRSITILFTLHVCVQIAVISLMLQNLINNFDKKMLGKIVTKHIHSLNFASKLEDIMCGMCFIEFFGCTFNICMLGYYFITEFEENETIFLAVVYTLLLTSAIFNIFIICYVGDLLTERCNSLGEAEYSIDWHKLSGKDARNVTFLIISTYHPVFLTAGKVVILSLQTFINVLKVSLSYLNILRTLIASVNESLF